MTSLRIRLSFTCQTAGVALMLSAMAVTTSAQTFTWDFGGVDNNWSTDGNWSPSPGAGGPDGAGVEVILDNTSSSTTITLDSDRTVGTVSIDDSDNYSLSGNTLTLDASSGSAAITIGNTNGNGAHTISSNLALADDLVITNNATGTFTASGIISGSNNLIKAGTGTVTFSGASTYSGTTTVSEGQLSLVDGAQSALSNSAVTVSSGATLMLEDFETFTLGSLAGGGTIDISDGVLETGGDNTSTTFSGSLDGDSFSIVGKQGSGTWTLTGSSGWPSRGPACS
ncbi:MAG: autotransporter-associated beta strand repeat-containing protein [Verrucomicrobiota bacterium]